MTRGKLLYSICRFIGSDTLFRALIKELDWSCDYYCQNKNGTKSKCVINYFPSNPELLSDNGEGEMNYKKEVMRKFKTGVGNDNSQVIQDISSISARLWSYSVWAKAKEAIMKRTSNDRLADIMIVEEGKKMTQWKVSHVPLKYLSIKP